MKQKVDIVIARYKEKIDWLEDALNQLKPNYDITVWIYNKGTTLVQLPEEICDDTLSVRTLPNVGRESHTYLHHITQHYDNLNDRYVIFLQGDFKEHFRWYGNPSTTSECISNLLQDALQTQKASTSFANTWRHEVGQCAAHYGFRIAAHSGQPLIPRSTKCFGDWYNEFVGEWNNSESWHTIPFWIGGLFAVSGNHIRARPVTYYERLRDCVGVSLNPEVGHFMERAWLGIFDLVEPPCAPQAYIRKGGKLL
jgi:hypothetical protein